ncbi:hypothetical protein LBMAG53_06430 [Planctomycetota bacterium]|nr:hypothetical protein LBMAG53_06430 [Planctomycetota bacterium]
MFLNLLARLGSPLLTLRDRRPRTPAAMLAAQERWLRRLISDLGPLPVGRQFGLDRLKRIDHATFRSSVPMTGYQDYSALFARIAHGERGVCFPGRCLALAQTSGTTSDAAAGERFIPQSKGLLAHQRRGAEAALARLLPATGRTIFDGKMLMMGGSTDLKPNAHGIPSGDLSGIVVSLIPEWLWGLYEPGREVALERDWAKKVRLMVERTRQSDLRLASGIGSWLLMFFENACKEKGVQRACEVWPNLRALIHGGHAFEPVIPQFRHHLHPETWLMEVYPASEAFIAVGSRPWRISESAPPPLELLTDHGIVIEFAPESAGTCDPAAAVLADGIEPGKLYRILLTTPGGLIRYQIGDLALGVGPGLIRFGGRVKTRISVFGEHVEGWQLADALALACAGTGAQVDHYHVAPVLPKPGETRGAHEWIVEFASPPSDLASFSNTIDQHLISQVADYEAHRQVQLHPPIITPVPAGTFQAFLVAKGKFGGQHKVPQAWPDRSIAEALLGSGRA